MSNGSVSNGPVQTYHGIADLEAAIGQEIGPTDWFTVDQSRINGFADDTEDHQWIHIDPERAATGPFGTTVAHGFLTLSLVPYLSSQLRTVEGARMAINYGLDKVGEGAVQLVNRVTIEVEGSAKPACVADMVSRLYFADTE